MANANVGIAAARIQSSNGRASAMAAADRPWLNGDVQMHDVVGPFVGPGTVAARSPPSQTTTGYKHVQAGGQHKAVVVSPTRGGPNATSHAATEKHEHGLSGWGARPSRGARLTKEAPRCSSWSRQVGSRADPERRAGPFRHWGPPGCPGKPRDAVHDARRAPAIAGLARYEIVRARPSRVFRRRTAGRRPAYLQQ